MGMPECFAVSKTLRHFLLETPRNKEIFRGAVPQAAEDGCCKAGGSPRWFPPPVPYPGGFWDSPGGDGEKFCSCKSPCRDGWDMV